MKTKQIIIDISSNEIDEDFIPEYYYYDKINHGIKTAKGEQIPLEYSHDIPAWTPIDLKYPYTVGKFQANKLIGYYGCFLKISDTLSEFRPSNGVVSGLDVFLTAKQKEQPIIYKVVNLITKQPLLVKEKEIQNTIDIKPIKEIIIKLFQEINTEYNSNLKEIIDLDNKIILTLKE